MNYQRRESGMINVVHSFKAYLSAEDSRWPESLKSWRVEQWPEESKYPGYDEPVLSRTNVPGRLAKWNLSVVLWQTMKNACAWLSRAHPDPHFSKAHLPCPKRRYQQSSRLFRRETAEQKTALNFEQSSIEKKTEYKSENQAVCTDIGCSRVWLRNSYTVCRKIQQMELKPGPVGSRTRQVQDKLQLCVCLYVCMYVGYFIETVPLNNQPSHVTQGQRPTEGLDVKCEIFLYYHSLKKKLFSTTLEFSRVCLRAMIQRINYHYKYRACTGTFESYDTYLSVSVSSPWSLWYICTYISRLSH